MTGVGSTWSPQEYCSPRCPRKFRKLPCNGRSSVFLFPPLLPILPPHPEPREKRCALHGFRRFEVPRLFIVAEDGRGGLAGAQERARLLQLFLGNGNAGKIFVAPGGCGIEYESSRAV